LSASPARLVAAAALRPASFKFEPGRFRNLVSLSISIEVDFNTGSYGVFCPFVLVAIDGKIH
jgi:hypothetical protein